ncbi:MAG TPA: hypothetical protein VFH74_04295 [Gaiellales bacterium]|nr:hypothetical protein [Gaiellales bacterium]
MPELVSVFSTFRLQMQEFSYGSGGVHPTIPAPAPDGVTPGTDEAERRRPAPRDIFHARLARAI